VLSSSRDLLLDDLVIALDSEGDLQHWKEKIQEEIQVQCFPLYYFVNGKKKAQGAMPKPGHFFVDTLISLKGKCDFCNQSLKRGYTCSGRRY
jgi:hypothetical protein